MAILGIKRYFWLVIISKNTSTSATKPLIPGNAREARYDLFEINCTIHKKKSFSELLCISSYLSCQLPILVELLFCETTKKKVITHISQRLDLC
ncbi:hypothetical protein Hanom_Chr07g00591541 [Helianthus anomalus]